MANFLGGQLFSEPPSFSDKFSATEVYGNQVNMGVNTYRYDAPSNTL